MKPGAAKEPAPKENIMTSILAFIKKYSVLAYYALTFAISWGGILILVGPGGLPGTSEQVERLMPFAILTFLLGPAVAGPLLTGLVYGRAGLRDLLSRLLRWRVGPHWYAVALLTAPLLMMMVLLALSLLSPNFLPNLFTTEDKATVLLVGIATALGAGFEELGWTGFAIPELRRRYSVLTTGLIVGVLWGVWHLLVYFWVSGTVVSGTLSLAGFLLDAILFLALYRVLMVWVYDRTESLLVAMLMHGSLTGSARILMPAGIVGLPLLTFDLVWIAALCVVIAVVAITNRGQLSRRPAVGAAA
jgi:uncharacterized protein